MLKDMLGDYTMFGPNVTIATAGHPCRVMREINEHDNDYYYKDRKITTKI